MDQHRTERRLLIVEDEATILVAMTEYFADQGYTVDSARTMGEARRLLVEHRYDVAITDLRLTGVASVEGLDLMRYARVCAPTTRFIVLTAYGSTAIERAARQLGARAVLPKPQPLPGLAAVVAALAEPEAEHHWEASPARAGE